MAKYEIQGDKFYGDARVREGSSIQWGQSKQKQSIYVRIQIEVLTGPCASWMLHWDGYFTDKTEERTIEALRIMGWQGDDLDKLEANNLAGGFSVTIERESDINGAPTEYFKVAWVNDMGGGGLKVAQELPADSLRHLSARLRQRAQSIRKREAAVIPEREQPQPTTDPGSDYTGGYGGDSGPGDNDTPF